MSDKKFKEYLYRYLDGELNDAETREFKQMLESSPLYSLQLEQEEKFHSLIKNHVQKEAAPYQLKEAVIKDINGKGRGWMPDFAWLKSWGAPAFSALFVILFSVGILFRINQPFPVFASSVESHMQYLKGSYPMEIVSSDMDEVNQWFVGKLDFAVQVPEFADKDIKLVGGRICHLKDKKVAYLMFEKNGHTISAFVIDVGDMRIPKSQKIDKAPHTFYVKSTHGYQSIICLNQRQRTGTGCVFVSDLPADQLLTMIL